MVWMGMALKRTPASQRTANNTREELPTILDHLRELRRRFFFVALALVGGSVAAYSVHDVLIKVLLAPLEGQKLVYLTPGGGFDFIFKISLYAGIITALPVLIYHLFRFLSPLMRRPSKRFVIAVVCASILFALTGIIFGYFVAVPSALHFLMTFAGDYIEANITAISYLNFMVMYLLGLALLFQLPLILLCINATVGPLKPSRLLASEGYVALGAFIVAAIITPTPDIMNQLLVALPVIGMYQLGILWVVLYNKAVRRRAQVVVHAPELAIPEEVARALEPTVSPGSIMDTKVPEVRPLPRQNLAPRSTHPKGERRPERRIETPRRTMSDIRPVNSTLRRSTPLAIQRAPVRTHAPVVAVQRRAVQSRARPIDGFIPAPSA